MEHAAAKSNIPPEHQIPDGTWIQITFTLDPEHYQMLWERAEAEHRTLACLIREAVTHLLRKKDIPHIERKTPGIKSPTDLP